MCVPRFSGVNGVSIYLYGYFWIWHATQVINEFLVFGCIKHEVIAYAPSDSLGYLNAVLGFIIIGEEAYNGCHLRV